MSTSHELRGGLGSRGTAWIPAVVAGLAALVLSGACTTTKRQTVTVTPAAGGFLGDAVKLLSPGKEGEADLRYVNEDADWQQYDKIMLEPVQFWASGDSKLPIDVEQMMTTYLYNSLKEDLAKQGFALADLPGKEVIRVQIAIMDVTAATPILRTVSVIVPQARVLNQAQELLTGTYGFSGSAEVALKATDSRTGELLAAALDKRSGGGSLRQAAQWKWGDAEAAMDKWSQMFTARLAELRAKRRASR